MDVKLNSSEIKIMNVIWDEGDIPAKRISDVLKEDTGWTLNTTYTFIKRCISKGAIERREPHFICHALIEREQVQAYETKALIDKLFGSSADKLFASMLSGKVLTPEEIQRLKKMVNEME